MKNAVTLVLILLSFAYSYETIEYFSRIRDTDFHSEENSSESEESSEKKESNVSDDNYFHDKNLHYKLISNPVELGWLSAQRYNQHANFSSNDYSHEVYSPPEIH